MATECNQEAVLYFIKERGGRVKNVALTDNFCATMPKDPTLKQVVTEAFKWYVDSVAYINVMFPEGVNSRTESELNGNSSNSTAEDNYENKSTTGGREKSKTQDICARRSACLWGRCRDCRATLEPLEHEWMMCATDGCWEKEGLRDGIHLPALGCGKHELIVMLVNFAREHLVAVNARSSAGYMPLHLAAMHNHLEIVKLLVGAFDGNVEARGLQQEKRVNTTEESPNLLRPKSNLFG
uniref:SOWAHA-C winged helix-turn-helix domain-containing protein n=1 Tax=Sinocyclocheilus rhinocerous TaxID=307959 RepID=A0A673LUF6_9TELE